TMRVETADATTESDAQGGRERRLATLERLLASRATDVKMALGEASDQVAAALDADKVDAFLYDPTVDTLLAVGTSFTPMGRRQHALGLNRLPISNGGRAVEVYQGGQPFRTGQADQDPIELPGIREELGVRSTIAVPLEVNGERRGVLQASSGQPEKFSERDLHFLETTARWVGMLTERAELVERLRAEAAENARRMVADELVTVLAHDLGTYLAAIIGRVDLIRGRAERQGRQTDLRDAEAAKESLWRLNRLVQDLLDVARLEQGLLALKIQPVELAGLAIETSYMLRTADTKIDVRVPEELVVEADPERIGQALENLLSNAIRHSPKGAPVLLQLDEERREDGLWAVMTVRDQGPGISPDLLPRIFDRFSRGPGSKGLGLGLYLSKQIAEAHGGTLTVDSIPGSGTTFRLALPLLSESVGG
ncbi:MAG TPA: GAF domain-containing sensor histidine kinase, partial [Ardenticatenaceae bacterium]|nr:GAF domain-containing sensor histidine kinase [Ardenticatenaceae bacterium]